MNATTDTVHITLSSDPSATRSGVLDAGNKPGDWLPSPFFRYSITKDEPQDNEPEEERWATLAASAREAWSKEHPF